MLLVFHIASSRCWGSPQISIRTSDCSSLVASVKFAFCRGRQRAVPWGSLVPAKRLQALSVLEPVWVQNWEEDAHDFAVGPLHGDLAEIESFCRIQRLAEQLHKAVMGSLRSLERNEEDNGTAFSSSLEEKVVAGLACIGATLHQGRLEIFNNKEEAKEHRSKKLPRLASLRSKLRISCGSLRTSLKSLIVAEGEQNIQAYRVLHKLINVCLDAGYARPERAPHHGYIPNFASVRVRPSEEVHFWRGGQISEEGLEWLLENNFKTVVDIRAEAPRNELAEEALSKAETSGIIRRVRIPVRTETAPTMEQVHEFAKIVAEESNRPVFLQSYAGVVRGSAMVSRWREFVLRGGLEIGQKVVEDMDQEDVSASGNILLEEKQLSEGDKVMENSQTIRRSPFEAQIPGPDIFSRATMKDFFKGRQVVPSSFLQQSKRKLVYTVIPEQSTNGVDPQNGRLKGDAVEGKSANGGLRRNKDDEDEIEGDMCASRTGVVRLQSRKKAEMYLVRADGFSCTRERVTESTLAFTHPSTQQQMLMWKTAPKTVLLLKKLGDELMKEAKMVTSFLYHEEGMNVMVEPEVHDRFASFPGFGYVQTFYNQDIRELHERVDFVVCLGGDGVILHASNLFRSSVPPVVSFNLGSLGFLTAHPFENYKKDLRAVIHGNKRIEGVYVTLRMRLRCEIFRDGQPVPGKVFEVLNEVVVDRGSNPYLCKIECYERNRLITKVQADGVLVATPTGSTAYSTAAGGSMVHPNVPCMLFTPICPHSLSFRPVILPDSAILELKVPSESRSNAWVSFDGKKRQQLSKGDFVRIHMSSTPMPTVNKSDQTSDWFRSLDRCFNWSARTEQKALC